MCRRAAMKFVRRRCQIARSSFHYAIWFRTQYLLFYRLLSLSSWRLTALYLLNHERTVEKLNGHPPSQLFGFASSSLKCQILKFRLLCFEHNPASSGIPRGTLSTAKMASLPQKKYYRQRAHSNPIADHCFD